MVGGVGTTLPLSPYQTLNTHNYIYKHYYIPKKDN